VLASTYKYEQKMAEVEGIIVFNFAENIPLHSSVMHITVPSSLVSVL
jgi:hypothetical protein